MVKVIFDMDVPFVLNNEMVVREPVEVSWWKGMDLLVDLLNERFLVNLIDDKFAIEITPTLFMVRRQKPVKFENPSLPIRFLSLIQDGEVAKARKLLGFEIGEDALRKWFGEFEILPNNYLGQSDVFSIVPKGKRIARNLKFEVSDALITNIV